MRLLITGSKGLIGSALKHVLRLLNIDVIGMDIRSDEKDPEYGDILNKKLLLSLTGKASMIIQIVLFLLFAVPLLKALILESMEIPELGISAFDLHELCVRSLFDELAVFEYEDSVH